LPIETINNNALIHVPDQATATQLLESKVVPQLTVDKYAINGTSNIEFSKDSVEQDQEMEDVSDPTFWGDSNDFV